jgi:hypothetical protein
VHGVDPGAVDLGDVGRVDEDEGDDAPEQRGARDAESAKSWRSKNDFRTAGQPVEFTTSRTTIAVKTSVLATATPTLRASPP